MDPRAFRVGKHGSARVSGRKNGFAHFSGRKKFSRSLLVPFLDHKMRQPLRLTRFLVLFYWPQNASTLEVDALFGYFFGPQNASTLEVDALFGFLLDHKTRQSHA